MKIQNSVILLVLFCFSQHALGIDFMASSLPSSTDNGNVREFYAANKEKRFLVRVHLWGDATLSGIYYIPDNATMLDLLGFAGGPRGVIEEAGITLHRFNKKTKQHLDVNFNGGDVVADPEYRNLVLQSGDVVFVDSPPKSDSLLRTLSIISTIAGIFAAGAAFYLVTRE